MHLQPNLLYNVLRILQLFEVGLMQITMQCVRPALSAKTKLQIKCLYTAQE